MIRQNANIIWIFGRVGFVVCYVVYTFIKYNINHIWNYLCYTKAAFRAGIRSLPSNFFDGSYLLSNTGQWQYFSDYYIKNNPDMMGFKTEFQSFLIHNLKVSGIFAVITMMVVGIVHKRLGKSLTDRKELISGNNYVSAKELKKLIKDRSEITLAEIPYPKGAEFRHTLITGTTGTGKTNVIIELIDQVQANGDRAIIVDTVGTYINRYYNPDRGDIILNPLDPRSVPWSFLEECEDNELLRNVASCLIDKGGDHDRFWEEAAKVVFVETAKKIQAEKKSLNEFIDVLLKMPLEDMHKYLTGTYGASLMDKNADKMSLSIRAMLINAVHVFDVLREEKDSNFSIRKWIENNNKGFLFLSCSPKERNTVIPMITAWLSIASDTLMQIPETEKSQVKVARTWFFIDELYNLKKLPKLDLALSEIRKFGGCFVIGTQAITGLCGTKVVMNIPEPITANYMADFLGEKEEITSMETLSYGANTIRDGANIAQRYSKESVVSGSQIMELGIGEAFVRFLGVPIIGKVTFKYHESKANNEYCRGINLLENKEFNISSKSVKEISKIFSVLRQRNLNAIIIDSGSEIYENYVRNIDIVVNLNKLGCSWDIVKEFEGDNISFIRALLDSGSFDNAEKKDLEIFLLKQFAKLAQIPVVSSNEVLKLIFDDINLADSLKDKLELELSHLRLLINNNKKITISRYSRKSMNCFLFIPCFYDVNLIKIAKMIKLYVKDKDIYIISNLESTN